MLRALVTLAALVAIAVVFPTDRVRVQPAPEPLAALASGPGAGRELVVLIVLDNVRADRMSLCGHARPTTPNLDRVCDGRNATCHCRAYAPGSWTIPSHASFFTGLDVHEHLVGGPVTRQEWEATSLYYRSLPDTVPTLAEKMADAGFRTAAISANPVLSEASGLLRGFSDRRVAGNFDVWFGDGIVRAVEIYLDKLPRGESSLFLFVNVIDAHGPWEAIPPGIDWAPPRERISFFEEDPADPRVRYLRGELDATQAEALLDHFADVYDYGVWNADRTLQNLLAALDERDWLDGRYRIIVTSDHGELIGEGSALGHGAPILFEATSRVPLVVIDSDPAASPDMSPAAPISATTAYGLALGELGHRPVRAAAFHAPGWWRKFGDRWGRHHGAAVWEGDEKYLLIDGETHRVDLSSATEPGGLRRLERGLHAEGLRAIAQRLDEARTTPIPIGSEEVARQLQALGYFE